MPASAKGRSRRRIYRALRSAMGLLLVLVGLFACALLYLNWVGLPDYLKNRLEARFRDRGVVLSMGSVRLSGLELIAEKVRLGPLPSETGPEAFIESAAVRWDKRFWTRGNVQPQRVRVKDLELSWVPGMSNLVTRRILLQDLEATVRFLPNDHLMVDSLGGRIFDAEVLGSISITNASAMRKWPQRSSERSKVDWRVRTEEFLTQLERLQLATGSTISFEMQGDGRNPASFSLELKARAPKAVWPRGRIDHLDLAASVIPATNHPGISAVQLALHAEDGAVDGATFQAARLESRFSGSFTNRILDRFQAQLRLDQFQMKSISGESIVLSALMLPKDASLGTFESTVRLNAAAVNSPWGALRSSLATGSVVHGANRSEPWHADAHLAVSQITTPWGEASNLRLAMDVEPRLRLADWMALDSAWDRWSQLEDFDLRWLCELDTVRSPKLEVETIRLAGDWFSPYLRVTELLANLYGGTLNATAELDGSNRDARANANLNFDVREISPFLTKSSQRWLRQFGWHDPPEVSAEMRVKLPGWTSTRPQWRGEVMPTIQIAGAFEGRNGTFRDVPVSYGRSHFALTNLVWYLPDLYVLREDGEAELGYTGHMGTHEYEWRVRSRVDPKAIKPLLPDPQSKRAIDQFQFTLPPVVEGTVSGRWHEPETVTFNARVAATNFNFRGEVCHEFMADTSLTNAQLRFNNVIIRQGTAQITVPSGSYDLTQRVVQVTNAMSTFDPDVVTRVIGPKVRAAIRPYRFEVPPTVRVNGRLPTTRIQDAAAQFDIVGEQFSYWKLRAPSVKGNVAWLGDKVSITNVQATCYGGELDWKGEFDFSVPTGAQFGFQGSVRNVDLNLLMKDLGARATNLQGSLHGQLAITDARSDDWKSWNGSGKVRLRDGFLWDIPIFGFFSPILNTVVPGLGNSPVSAGSASFKIDRSVIRTSNLELKSPALRLQYTGSVDFEGAVDARMQAEIFRDAWAVGRLISFALWPISKAFEYEVNGTVYRPETHPVYIPKALMWPLHPIKTLKKLFRREQEDPVDTP